MLTRVDQEVIAEMNLPTPKQISREFEFYHSVLIPVECKAEKVDFGKVCGRKVQIYFESFSDFPQNLFFFYWLNKRIFGKKTVSKQHIEGSLKELHCCQILSHMVLGVVCEEQITQAGVLVFYYPFTSGERLACFHAVFQKKSINISYNYVYLSKDGKKERCSPSQGWKLDVARAHNLGVGEGIIRDYTVKFLKKFSMKKKVVYDPACSTGMFLHTIKDAYPECITIGQDLSKQMVVFAKNFVDEVYHLDAMCAPIVGRFADFIFIRFLNSEVVVREQAQKLYHNIIERCKPGGYVIILGHTPILLSLYDLEKEHMTLLQKSAKNYQTKSIFQYYVLRFLS